MAETSGEGKEIKPKKSSVPLMQEVNKIVIPILIVLESCDLLIPLLIQGNVFSTLHLLL